MNMAADGSSLAWTIIVIGVTQLLAVVSPGPSFLITAQTAVSRSRGEGVKVALGLAAGTVVWAAAALAGLHVVFKAAPVLFMAAKAAGALFLLYVAWQIFRHAAAPLEMSAPAGGDKGRSSFMRGFLTQISNPKVAIFFGSIFVAQLPDNVPFWLAALLVFIVSFNEFWWYSAVALFFGVESVRGFYLRAKVWLDRVTGLFLGALGLRLLWSAADPV